MANDLVVRLSGDNSALQRVLSETRRQLQNTADTSVRLEDIQKQFKRITDTSAPLSRKIRDIKKAMEMMALSGIDATEEGSEMWSELTKIAQDYDATLKKIAEQTKSVPPIEVKEEPVATLESIKSKFDGIVESSSPLNAKISDIRKALEEMATSGLAASEEGQQLWGTLAEKAREYDSTLKLISEDTKNVPPVEIPETPIPTLESIKTKFEGIQNSTDPLKTKIAEIKKTLEDMTTAGLRSSDEGQQLWESLSTQARQYDAALREISDATKDVPVIEIPETPIPTLESIKEKFEGIQGSADPLKTKIADIKKAMEDMTTAGLRSSEEGKTLWESLSAQARTYDTALREIAEATREVPVIEVPEEPAMSLDLIRQRFEEIKSSGDPLSKKISEIKRALEDMGTAGLSTSDEGRQMWEELVSQARGYQEQINEVSTALSGLDDMAVPTLDSIIERFDDMQNSSEPLTKKIGEIKSQLETMAAAGLDASDEGKALWERLVAESKKYKEQIDKVNKAMAETAKPIKTLDEVKKKFAEIKESASPLNAKISDIRKAMEEMSVEGLQTSEEGQKMWKELCDAAKGYEAQIKQIKKATSNLDEDIKLPDLSFKKIGNDIAKHFGLDKVADKATQALTAINPVVTGTAVAIGATMVAAGKASADFETHLDDLQALTLASDEVISQMGDTALKMSKKFGLSASDIVDAMGLIGSQAPYLLEDAEALSFVTDAAMTLAKGGSIAAEEAASAITAVTNQMGVSADEALNIANALEAAEQKGAGSVEFLNAAISKSGVMAAKAGLSYVELISLIESAAPKFEGKAEEAGTAIQGIFLSLANAEDKFNPAVVGMSQALENLNAAHLSQAEMTKLVGQSGTKMLQVLINEREEFARMQSEIDGTNAAVDAWRTKSDNMAGQIDRLKATWDAFLIKLGQSGIIQGICDQIEALMGFLMDVIDVISEIVDAFRGFGDGAVDDITGLLQPLGSVQEQLEILGKIIQFLGTVISVAVRLISVGLEKVKGVASDASDYISEKWEKLKKVLGDVAFARFIINAFERIMTEVGKVITKVKDWWHDLKKTLGVGVKVETEGNRGMIADQRKRQEAEAKKQIAEDTLARNAEAEERAKAEKAAKKDKKGSSKTEKIDYLASVDDNSLDVAEKKLSAWQSKKKSLPITATADIKNADDEVKKWTEEVARRKLALTADGAEALKTIEALEKELSGLRDQKTLITAETEGQDKVNALEAAIDNVSGKEVGVTVRTEVEVIDTQVTELESKLRREKIRLGIIVPEVEDGSVVDLQEKIKKLEDEKSVLIRTKAEDSAVKEINEEIKTLKKELESEQIRVGVLPYVAPDSVHGIEKTIKEKEKELDLLLDTEADPESIKKLVNELEELRKREKEKRIEIGVDVEKPTISVEEPKRFERGSKEDKKQSLSNAQTKVEEIRQDYKLGLIGKAEVVSQIEQIDNLLKSLDLKPLKLTVNDDGTIDTSLEKIDKYKEKMEKNAEAIGAVGNAFTSLGGAIGGTGGEVVKFAGESLNAVSKILPQIATLIAAKEAEAMASGLASASATMWPANIAAMASIVATIAGLFASLPKFESGGIVGGSSYVGDKLLARVNSGELILNKKQQSSLYGALSDARPQPALAGQVDFKISGTDLKGTLRNFDKKMSKIK